MRKFVRACVEPRLGPFARIVVAEEEVPELIVVVGQRQPETALYI